MTELTAWDFFIAFLIVAFDEYIIKKLILRGNEKYKAIYTYAPILLGVIVYLAMAFFAKGDILNGCIHGLLVGLTAMGSYDVILRIGKEKGIASAEAIGESIKEEVEKEKQGE